MNATTDYLKAETGIHPLPLSALIQIALPGIPVANWKLKKTYEKAALASYREEPEEFTRKVIEGELLPLEEASAWSALLNPSHPEARLFAISTIALVLRTELEKVIDELAKEHEPAGPVEVLNDSSPEESDGPTESARNSHPEDHDVSVYDGRSPSLEGSEMLEKWKGENEWRRKRSSSCR